MALTKDQAEIIKKQLIEHISQTFPDEKKEMAIEQINRMNENELEEFVKQNNLVQNGSEGGAPPEIFRQIVEGKIPSHWVGENNDAMAVLEINPISKGHTIIIPKNKVENPEEMPQKAMDLAEEIRKKLKLKLKPKEVIISPAKTLGEIIVNVIPSYDGENQNSEKKQASKEDLESTKEMMNAEEEKIIKEPKTKKIAGKKARLPNRIP